MAQLHDKHLTTEQLSASFDKQLSPQEQAMFDAHISTCQACERRLADLRLTIALLHALPDETAPRSFVLPGNLSFVPERTVPVTQERRAHSSSLRRSIRVVSTLAAVLALFFIISGILPQMYPGATNSSSSTSFNSNTREAGSVHSTATTPDKTVSSNVQPQEKPTTITPTPIPNPTASPTGTHQTNQGPGIPPVLDPGQPAGRLSLGILLLILGIIGLIFSRRRRITLT